MKGKKPFKCEICDVTFAKKGDMKNHISSIHEREGPLKCTFSKKMSS